MLFADDTNILFNEHRKNNLQFKISETSNKLEEWLTQNKLQLNVNKIVYIAFSQRKVNDSVQIILNNTIINQINQTEFLGIWIDSNLTWRSHIQCLTEKLSRLCYIF